MTSLVSINAKLSSLSVTAGFGELTTKANEIASSVQALNSSSLGTILNENISGIQSLNTTLDAAKSIAILTENLTGLQSQVVKDVASAKTQLDKITGVSVSNGFLDLVITSSTAEGVKNAIENIAIPSEAELNAILTNVVPKQFSAQIDGLVNLDFPDFVGDFKVGISDFTSGFSNLIGSATGNVLQDIVLQTDNSPISLIEDAIGTPAIGLADVVSSVGDIAKPISAAGDIFNLIKDDQFNVAVSKVAGFSGGALPDIELALSVVPKGLEDQLDKALNLASSIGVFDVASKNNAWNGSQTSGDFFDIIPTQEQLHIELIKSSREITEIIFFGHEMSANQVLTATEIHDSYNEDGGDGIPFHFVILPNGNLQRGRPLAQDGSYSSTHNKFSIGIVIPHVVDTSATESQGATVRAVMESFYEVWPGGQVFDAYVDTDDSEINVGVPIESLIRSFKKVNKGSSSRSFSNKQLISAAQGNV